MPSTGALHPDGVLKNTVRKKTLHYRQIYEDKLDTTIFIPVTVNTSGRIYDDFVRLFFLHEHREASVLVGELPEESNQFHFLRATRLTNLKDSVGVILVKVSTMRVTICLLL